MPPTVVYNNWINSYERGCGKIMCVCMYVCVNVCMCVCLLIHVFVTCWEPFLVLTLLGPVILMGIKDTDVAKHNF